MSVTDHDLSIARDVGALQADVRTVKHDVVNISAKLDALSAQIGRLDQSRSRGLGFFTGAAFIVTTFGAAMVAFAKLIWGTHS